MLGSSGTKVVSDLGSLAELAAVIQSPEKLNALRKEFETKRDDLLALQKETDAKLIKAAAVKEYNDNRETNLKSREAYVTKREADAEQREKSLSERETWSLEGSGKLQDDQKAFLKEKADFAVMRDTMIASLHNIEADTKAAAEAKSGQLAKLEEAIRVRESKVADLKAEYDSKLGKLQSILSVGKN